MSWRWPWYQCLVGNLVCWLVNGLILAGSGLDMASYLVEVVTTTATDPMLNS